MDSMHVKGDDDAAGEKERRRASKIEGIALHQQQTVLKPRPSDVAHTLGLCVHLKVGCCYGVCTLGNKVMLFLMGRTTKEYASWYLLV